MLEPIVIVAIISVVGAILGAFITFRSTKGKTKTDAKTALDARIDARLDKQLETAWAQIDSLTAKGEEDHKEIQGLKDRLSVTDRIGLLMYQYTQALRNHIVKELPPPPPTAPLELSQWFSQYEERAH